MRTIFESVKNNPLFQGIAFSDFEKMLDCLSANTACYKKGGIILLAGDAIGFIGLVLSGGVQVVREDLDGRIAILAGLGVSDVFGEAFACAGVSHSPVSIQATEDTKVLFLDYKRVVSSCSSACPFHSRLIENMLKLLATKNLMLNQKIEILSKRTTREKLMCYFDSQRGAAKRFTIPFNREELAQYLCVDRSAMSNELCKMRDAGLIVFDRKEFEVF